jgi:hypothetical protein
MKMANRCSVKFTNRYRLLIVIALAGILFPVILVAQNTNYVVNKAPLVPTPFVTLPLGSIKANGWLATQLNLQKEGLTGYSEIIYSELKSDAAWLGGNAPNSDWERPTYYLKGLVVLAYSLNDSELKQKAQKWIDWALNSQTSEGNFGPATNNDWWARMPMLTAMMDYCDATNDARVIPFLTNYFRYQFNSIDSRPFTQWASARAADNVDVIFWLYNRTGDNFLLALTDKIKSQVYNYTNIFTDNTFITNFHSDFYPKHGVNVSQAYKYAPVFYQRTNNAKDKDAFMVGIKNLRPYHTQITGMNSCTEFLSGNSSVQGVELCGTVERMFCNEIATRIIGDPLIGDDLEKITFNQLPAAFSPDMHQHQYYTLPNQVQSKQGSNGYAQDYGNGVLPGPFSGYPCCRFNMHMGWPKYTQHCWMATADNGIVATAYAPSTVNAKVANGIAISITEETHYPFEEQIRFTVNTSAVITFPFKLRIPSWCAAPVVKVNGQLQRRVLAGSYYTINRTWKNGDQVTLDLPMAIKASTWINNSVGIERGPIVYSLNMNEQWKLKASHTFDGKDFSEYEVYPTRSWNYGLVIDRDFPEKSITIEKSSMPVNPFIPESTPVKLKVNAKKIPLWGLDVNGIHAAEPPVSPVASASPQEEVTLIPFGAQRIRVTYFPVIGTPIISTKTFNDKFLTNGSNQWVNFGGGWQQSAGKYYSESYNIKGVKSVAMNTDFTDFTYEATISIQNDATEAGVLFRVSNPANGADNFKGYYAGISTSGKIILGKSDNAWSALSIKDESIKKSTPYHLRVVVRGSDIKVYLEDMITPKVNATDNTFSSGAIGLRQYCGSETPDPTGQTVIFEKVFCY